MSPSKGKTSSRAAGRRGPNGAGAASKSAGSAGAASARRPSGTATSGTGKTGTGAGPVADRTLEHLVVAAIVLLGSVVAVSGVFDPAMLPKLTVVLLGVIALAALAVVRGALERVAVVASGWWLPVVGVYAAALVVATVTSSNRTVSVLGVFARWTGLVPYLAYLVLLVLVVALGRPVLRPLVVAHVLALAVVVVYALAQVVGIDLVDWQVEGATPIFSAFGNVNFASGWTGAVLPFALFGVLEVRETRLRAALAALVVGAIVVLWQAGSAQGVVAAGAGCALLVGIWAAQHPGDEPRDVALRRWGPRVMVAGCLAVAVAVAAYVAFRPDAGVTQRFHFWDAALTIFAEQPVLGSGLDTYGDLFLSERSAEGAVRYGLERNEAPHSVPLGMLSNGGVVLALAYLSFVVSVGVVLVRGLRRLRGDERLALAAFGAVWLGYQVQSTVSFDVPPVALVHHTSAAAILILGLADATRSVELPGMAEARRRRRRRSGGASGTDVAVVAVVAVVALGLSALATRPMRAELTVGSAADLLDAGRGPEALQRLRTGIDLAPWEPSYKGLLASLLVQAGQPQDAYDLFEEASEQDPGSVQLPLSTAALATELGRTEQAARWYDEARRRDPNSPATLIVIGQAALANGEIERARDLGEQAGELDPDGVSPLVLQGQALAAGGDADGARARFERALRVEPQNPAAVEGLAGLDAAG